MVTSPSQFPNLGPETWAALAVAGFGFINEAIKYAPPSVRQPKRCGTNHILLDSGYVKKVTVETSKDHTLTVLNVIGFILSAPLFAVGIIGVVSWILNPSQIGSNKVAVIIFLALFILPFVLNVWSVAFTQRRAKKLKKTPVCKSGTIELETNKLVAFSEILKALHCLGANIVNADIDSGNIDALFLKDRINATIESTLNSRLKVNVTSDATWDSVTNDFGRNLRNLNTIFYHLLGR